MTKKEKTAIEAFYRFGFTIAKLNQIMEENANAFRQGVHSVGKFRDKITRRQQLAIWILDTAERFAEWVG